MIIDLKYHIASLTAVFLALGIGIFIGTTLIGNDVMTKQQEKLVTSLQGEFATLRDENKKTAEALAEMQENANYQQQFNRSVLPVLVQQKLQGRKVAIFDLNYRKEHDTLVNVLQLAGADVESVTYINLNMFRDIELNRQVADFFGLKKDKDEKIVPLDRLLPVFADFLVESILSGGSNGNNELISYLEEKDAVKISGAYGIPLQDIIIIGGSNKKENDYAKIFDLVLVKKLKNKELRIFGVEDSKVGVSYMRYYLSAKLTTVDNIDTVYGQIALVQAMARYPGHYGIKQTADAFMPPLI